MDGPLDPASSDAARAALTQFGLSGATLTAVPSFSHHVVCVRSSRHIAYLKEYPASMEACARQSVALAERVRRAGIAAPLFWRTRDGEVCASVDDHLFTLSHSLGEETLLQWQGRIAFDSVPRFLAGLHEALGSCADSESASFGPWPVMWDSLHRDVRLEELASYFRNSWRPRHREFLAALDEVRRVRALTPSLHEIRTPWGPIQGDFWPGNIIRTGSQDGQLGIVDFDDAFYGPRLLDVAQFVDLGYALFSGSTKVGINIDGATRFARRYVVEAGLPYEILWTLPLILVAARTCSILWIIEQHVTSGPSPRDALIHNDVRTIRFVLHGLQMWQDRLLAEVDEEAA